jgi:hypothetical protein
MAGFLVITGIIGFFLGFFWHWMWIFPLILIGLILHDQYESYVLKKQIEEIKKNSPYVAVEPQLGMTEQECKRANVWGYPNYVRETITEEGIEREAHFDFKGKLYYKNNTLVKIVRFDNNSIF